MTSDRYRFSAQVRWSDPDQMGHINHTRYLTYFEDARLAAGRSPSGGRRDERPGLHRGPDRGGLPVPGQVPPGPDAATSSTWVGRIGTTSCTLLGELFDGEQAVARSEVVLVAYSYPDDAKRPLTDEERAFLSRYVEQ